MACRSTSTRSDYAAAGNGGGGGGPDSLWAPAWQIKKLKRLSSSKVSQDAEKNERPGGGGGGGGEDEKK
ncbi:hypothetical protein LY76DRAFT_279985 [Colletotrichum caudatum]|nr:hypothetical protein LY76DRAFT_279985 [Colletotrichum caudatum]